MNGIKWNFLILAIVAAFSIIGAGFSLGAGSILGMMICLIVLIAVMGYGFATKKKFKESGKL
ncbi:YlaF family protein [Siminovitchia sediminis]|uniref:YlaF family protein n=1 Tax=Siminovitchia sediminis TaxID=1274353 RepID=A0ABW4KHT7_9BACI